MSDVRHVVMYTPTPNGGHARYTQELLVALSELGAGRNMSVSLVTSTSLDPGFRTSAYPIHDMLPPLPPRGQFRNPVHWMWSRVRFYRNRERGFVRWIEQQPSIDAVHFQEYTNWLAPFHFRRLRTQGIKTFYTVHNVRWNSYPPFVPKTLIGRLNRAAQRSCDALFVHSDALRDELAAELGRDHPPIHVTPHGIWRDARDPASLPGANERLARKHLLCFGILSPYKGIHVLLEVLKYLPDVTLTIAGAPDDDAYLQWIRSLIAKCPAGQVTLIDRFIDDAEIGPLFANSSVLVLPYVHFSAQSGVLHDAIAHGVPVVGTDVGAIGNSIRQWNIGQVAPPNDAVALAASIHRMLQPGAYAQAIAAMDQARAELSWERSAEAILDVYQAMIPERGSPNASTQRALIAT